ncbi:MAG TPA: pyridoxamine 5'-phosphate oxidase family protein [Gemmatimonadaceae bacterium]|nr:pyridoxamine 5'-phosphate oxidase family protein [Gemmatimonadaceae bacterium]
MLNVQPLSPDEITSLLARNKVGRIAYSTHDRVDVEPLSYVYAPGWIYGRTAHGAKLATLAKNKWVAFEVDEVKSIFDWQSVVVHGGVYVLEPGPSDDARAVYAQALSILRTLLPSTFREDDPVPDRDVIFRIAIQESTGRRASSRA